MKYNFKLSKVSFSTVFLLFTVLFTYGQYQDTSRVDVEHYSIRLDSVNIPAHYIKGSCKISYHIKKSTSQSYFMLKSLSIDSIVSHSGLIQNFISRSPDITINYISTLPAGMKDSFTVYYKGNPFSDIWGGFYFSNADGGYAYNMGISMTDFPHSYGRVWFPCIDLFTDRASYTLNIRTLPDQAALSGGILQSKNTNPDGTISWLWQITKPVPPDLVSVAIGPYSIVVRAHTGLKSNYPLVYGVRYSDSNNLLASFINIHKALNIFESKFGPYRFDKVGFSVVPFNSGAMEHSENISYPKNAIDGTLASENLWSHELSHSWWGNLLKCYTSEDMWLNEGWASYAEHVFTEGVYGREAYIGNIKTEQKYVLQYAHTDDGSALALSPLPISNTYGTHAYQKGSVVVHTLRTYLGDSLFYLSCQKYLESMAFKNHNSYQLRDSFSKYSGVDLNDFFNDWVFQPGFPHFEIIKTNYNQANSEYSITIKQSSRFNSISYHNVPIKISFFNDSFERFDYKILISAQESIYVVKSPWKASLIALNIDQDISEAITKNIIELNSISTYSMKDALMDITVKSLPSKALIEVEHHWNGPDHHLSDTKRIRFSDYRYWTVDGVFPAGFSSQATIRYNGVEGSSHDGSNFLDHTLGIQNEDSIVLLYRPDKLSAWSVFDNYQLFTLTNKTDKKGQIRINELKKGDYCIGIHDYFAGISVPFSKNMIKIYPNPAKSDILVDLSHRPATYKSIRLIDSSGKMLYSRSIDNEIIITIDIRKFKSGVYFVEITTSNDLITEKVVIE